MFQMATKEFHLKHKLLKKMSNDADDYFKCRDALINQHQKYIYNLKNHLTNVGLIWSYDDKKRYGWIESDTNPGESIYFNMQSLFNKVDTRCCKAAEPNIFKLLKNKVIFRKRFDSELMCNVAFEIMNPAGTQIDVEWICTKCESKQRENDLNALLQQIIAN